MNRERKRYSSRAELRAKDWIERQLPQSVRSKHVKDVKEGTFFVKREVDLQESDPALLDAVNEAQCMPNLDILKILSVSIIGPGDGQTVQAVARASEGSTDLYRIREKVDADLNYPLTARIGRVGCFGASSRQAGKRFMGYYVDSGGRLANERQEILGLYDIQDMRGSTPHLSIASTRDQVQAEAALDALRGVDVQGARVVLKPAEFTYVYR